VGTTLTTGLESINNGSDLDTLIYVKPGYPVRNTSGNILRVIVTLTNGAVFTYKPTLLCAHSGTSTTGTIDIKGVTGAFWADVQSGDTVSTSAVVWKISNTPGTPTTNGLSSYSFTFPDGFNVAVAGSGACLLSVTAGNPYAAAIFDSGASVSAMITNTKSPGQNISLNVDVMSKNIAVVTASTSIPMISFVTAYQLTTTTTTPAAGQAVAQVDVTKQSKQFVDAGMVAVAGSMGIETTTAATLRSVGGVPVTAGDIIKSATVTISGPPIRTLGGVTLVAGNAAACANQTTIGTKIAATSSGAAETISILLTPTDIGTMTAGATNPKLIVCLNAPTASSTPMEIGQVSIAASMETSGAPVDLGSGDLVNVTRNGTVVRVLSIPRGDGVDPFKINIRMYNASGQKIQNITGSLYGVDGKAIKEGMILMPELAPYNVKRVTSADLMTLVGTPWTGRPWLVIQAPASPDTFKVQALMVNPNGVVSNISTDALN